MRFQNLLLEVEDCNTLHVGKMQTFNLQDLGLFMKILCIRKNNYTILDDTKQSRILQLTKKNITIYAGKAVKKKLHLKKDMEDDRH
jgi:hypothetical protein